MTQYAALAITGAVFFVAAVIFAVAAEENYRNPAYAVLGWLSLAAAAGCCIGAAWWAAS